MAAFEARCRHPDPTLRLRPWPLRRHSASIVHHTESLRDIAWASNSIHWVTILLYILYAFAIALTVPMNYLKTPSIFAKDDNTIDFHNSSCGNTSTAALVPFCNNGSPMQYYQPKLAGFINGCLLYSVISAGNTSLYMASRTIYGLGTVPVLEDLQGRRTWMRGLVKRAGSVDPRTGVPIYAVVLSYLIFCCVPWLGFKENGQWTVLAQVRQQVFAQISAECLCRPLIFEFR